MPYAERDGVRIFYETDGEPADTAVVFIEGLGYGRWMWNWQRDAVADTHHVIVIDNRGTGRSDEPEGPYTIAGMAADVEAVLTAAGVERAHLVGASMGGMIAQQYALDHARAASLALLCTTPGGPEAEPTPPETLERMFGVPAEYDERAAIRYKMEPAMTAEFWASNDDLIERIVDWRLAMDAPKEGRQNQAAAVEAFDVSDRLQELQLPTTVMHGERDRVVPIANGRLLAEGVPEAELVTFEEGGSHLFFIERADSVTDALLSSIPDEQ